MWLITMIQFGMVLELAKLGMMSVSGEDFTQIICKKKNQKLIVSVHQKRPNKTLMYYVLFLYLRQC